VALKIGKFTIDIKALSGIALAVLGWVASSGPTIVSTLPVQWQQIAGNVVTLAGFILTFFASAPKKETPSELPPSH
jgi:hypothetical protein